MLRSDFIQRLTFQTKVSADCIMILCSPVICTNPLIVQKSLKESQKNHLNALTAEFLLKLYYVKYEAEKYIIAYNCETY